MKVLEFISLGAAAGFLAGGHPAMAFFIAVFGLLLTIANAYLDKKYAEIDMDDYRDS